MAAVVIEGNEVTVSAVDNDIANAVALFITDNTILVEAAVRRQLRTSLEHDGIDIPGVQ